jgi:predicted ester cyclase
MIARLFYAAGQAMDSVGQQRREPGAMILMSAIEAAARNKKNYLEAKRAFNRRDIDACMAFYSADHQMRSREVGPGREHIRAFLASMHATWSNLEIVAEHVVAEGEWVMGRCTSSAIHSTSVMGVAPTHRRIETTFWDLHRFNQDGLIVETWNVVDGLAIMQQLTAPKPATAG